MAAAGGVPLVLRGTIADHAVFERIRRSSARRRSCPSRRRCAAPLPMFTCATNGTSATRTVSPSIARRSAARSDAALRSAVHVVGHRAGVVEHERDFDRRAGVASRDRVDVQIPVFVVDDARQAHRHRHADDRLRGRRPALRRHVERVTFAAMSPISASKKARAAALRCAIERFELRSATSAAPSTAFCICVAQRLRAREVDGDADQAHQHGAHQRPHHGDVAAALARERWRTRRQLSVHINISGLFGTSESLAFLREVH